MSPRLAPYVAGLVLSFTMTGIISLAVTTWNFGLTPGLLSGCLVNWLVAWAVAFPSILVLGPAVRNAVARRVTKPLEV